MINPDRFQPIMIEKDLYVFNYIFDTYKNNETIIFKENKLQVPFLKFPEKKYTKEIGFFLLSFINNYSYIEEKTEKLIKEINTYSYKQNNNDILLTSLHNYFDNLKQIVPEISDIFMSEIFTFEYYLHFVIPEYKKKLEKNIHETKILKKHIKKHLKEHIEKVSFDIAKQTKEYEEITDINFVKNEYLDFFTSFSSKLRKIYEKSTSAFVVNDSTYTNTNTKFFKISSLELPKTLIKFDYTLRSKPISYEYTFSSISDFVNTSLYHISLSNKVITKCKNCGAYFIPKNRNDEIYCDRINENNKTCKEIGKLKSFKNRQFNNDEIPSSYFFHKAIYDRLKNNHKYKTELEKFEEKYIKIKNSNFTNQAKKEVALLSYLTVYDKKFQKKNPITRGRGYTTQQYWYET